ncbi:transglutaminase-like domain-containing protein [Termitidicoccus mucosus]|uniref:Protein SirB1 N-terminal domain-containing protein n=1 Tax=Termitidicoccus mucosus TaxID=1184151 RepID=A0A178IJV9_9BACT|nr:hypothetical protein AW736_12480 [Opitutaceae bacterium TSB47]
MKPRRINPARQAAFRALLDDPHPPIRQALLGHFQQLGHPAAEFLQRLATGSNRILAIHARWFLGRLKFSDPVSEFRNFIRSLNYELETGVFLLTRTVSHDLDVAACCQILDAIAARCRALFDEPMSLREKCRVINRVLFHECGFHGNIGHYNDPLNSLLDHVLARKKGIPVSLCIVYLLVARRLDLPLEPVALPGHFVVGCHAGGAPFFIDAFEQGTLRSAGQMFLRLRASDFSPRPADLAPTPVREVLCRCCRNLANHYGEAGDDDRSRMFASFVGEFDATHARHMRQMRR